MRVEVLSQTPNPQQAIYAAMHQDYAEGFVWDDLNWDLHEGIFNWEKQFPSVDNRDDLESACGDRIIKHLLAGHRGHYGPLEHPQIVLNCGWFPHSTMQQVRTHRVGVSFDCQSMRYTGRRITEVAIGDRDIEDVFYLRPLGEYTDRQGKRYTYTEEMRAEDIEDCRNAANKYAYRVEELGLSEEHARGLIPFDVRQHWVMSANVRSLMHLLDLRMRADAQLECQWLCELIWPHFQAWVPTIADWYEKNRKTKGRLAP